MSLAAHATVGAIAASQFPNHPIVGFFVAFASHFILDMVPHWDYHLGSMQEDEADPLGNRMAVYSKNFIIDLFKVGFDFTIGLVAAVILLVPSGDISALPIVLIGVFGGVLPDFLQFAYMLFPKSLIWLQRFHVWIHTKNHMKGQPVLSIAIQASFVLGVFYLARL